MNDITLDAPFHISQTEVDAILVDFINYVGAQQGVDYALYTKDLRDELPK